MGSCLRCPRFICTVPCMLFRWSESAMNCRQLGWYFRTPSHDISEFDNKEMSFAMLCLAHHVRPEDGRPLMKPCRTSVPQSVRKLHHSPSSQKANLLCRCWTLDDQSSMTVLHATLADPLPLYTHEQYPESDLGMWLSQREWHRLCWSEGHELESFWHRNRMVSRKSAERARPSRCE